MRLEFSTKTHRSLIEASIPAIYRAANKPPAYRVTYRVTVNSHDAQMQTTERLSVTRRCFQGKSENSTISRLTITTDANGKMDLGKIVNVNIACTEREVR